MFRKSCWRKRGCKRGSGACHVRRGIEAMETTYAIAITGYAGPGGGEEAPVGTIWIAVGDKNEVTVEKLEGDDGRDMNLAKATLVALQLLLDLLKKRHPQEEE